MSGGWLDSSSGIACACEDGEGVDPVRACFSLRSRVSRCGCILVRLVVVNMPKACALGEEHGRHDEDRDSVQPSPGVAYIRGEG